MEYLRCIYFPSVTYSHFACKLVVLLATDWAVLPCCQSLACLLLAYYYMLSADANVAHNNTSSASLPS
jgi:hypothetical protein